MNKQVLRILRLTHLDDKGYGELGLREEGKLNVLVTVPDHVDTRQTE